jgi:hypothetical protein
VIAPFRLSLADSEVSAIAVDADGVSVAFSAAAVRRGDDAGYARSLRLRLRAVSRLAGVDGLGRIREGRLWVAGRVVAAPDAPSDPAGPARIELVFQNGVVFEAEAASVAFHFDADPGFVLSYAC